MGATTAEDLKQKGQQLGKFVGQLNDSESPQRERLEDRTVKRVASLVEVLKGKDFLRKIAKIVEASHKSLEEATRRKPEADSANRELGYLRRDLQDATDSLRTIRGTVSDIRLRICKRLGSDLQKRPDTVFEQSLEKVIECLKDAEWQAELLESEATRNLPERLRKPHYKKSPWPSLWDEEDLSRFRKKELEHKLWSNLHKHLARSLPREVPDETRYVIIAVLLAVFGDGWVEPATIKQSFYARHPKGE
jgi:hypothetical protein